MAQGKVSGKPLWEGFSQSLHDFNKRTTHIEVITKYLVSTEGHDDVNFGNVKSLLSIGPGLGEIEDVLIRLSPLLEEVVLIEPDVDLCSSLQETLEKKHQHIKMSCINTFFETYDGPKGGFDLVFFSHSIYYFNDIELQLKRTLDLVKEGGQLVLIMVKPSIHSILSELLGAKHGVGKYDKVKDLITEWRLSYKEKILEKEYDFSNPGESGYYDALNVLNNCDTEYEQKKELIKTLKKQLPPGVNVFKSIESAFIITKKWESKI